MTARQRKAPSDCEGQDGFLRLCCDCMSNNDFCASCSWVFLAHTPPRCIVHMLSHLDAMKVLLCTLCLFTQDDCIVWIWCSLCSGVWLG